MTNWTKVLIGTGIFFIGFAEPTPFVEAYGLMVISNGLGIKQIPIGW